MNRRVQMRAGDTDPDGPRSPPRNRPSLSPLRRGGAFACTVIALFILIAVSAVTVIDIGGVFVAPAYPVNQAEGAGFTVLFISAPALVVVSLLGAAALFLARTGLGGVFIAIGLT